MHFNQEFLQNLLQTCYSERKCGEDAENSDMCIEVPTNTNAQKYKIVAYKIEDCIEESRGKIGKRADCLFLIKNVSTNTTKPSDINSIALLIEMKTSIGPLSYDEDGNLGRDNIKKGCDQIAETCLWIEESEETQDIELEASKEKRNTQINPIIVIKRSHPLLPIRGDKSPYTKIRGESLLVKIVPYAETKETRFWENQLLEV